ncbi:MAG: hypothetical protein U0804_05610 [Gemmataceae bacterium]
MTQSRRPTPVLLVLVGALALLAARPPAPPAPDDLDARRRALHAATAAVSRLADELAAGRIGLAYTTDCFLDAHAENDALLAGVHTVMGGETLRESVARSLVYRVEAGAERPALRAEYAALFGRPYTPPTL